MKYDKLKKVVNAFILALKDGVIQVTLNVDGIRQVRLLTYVGKEPSIKCDPETEYKCVLTCYDNLLQQDFTFRMRDVESYRDISVEAADLISIKKTAEAGCQTTERQIYTFIYKENCGRMVLKDRFDFSYDETSELPEVKNAWIDIIRHYRNLALTAMDKERTAAEDADDSEAIIEIDIIAQMLRDLPETESLVLDQFRDFSSIISYWPPILLPAPYFLSAELRAPMNTLGGV